MRRSWWRATVEGLNCDERPYRISLDDGQQIAARSIVLATGAAYNQPALPNIDRFTGRGIYYNATFMEGQLCSGDPVIVIGGGNSAGQAAVFLAQNTKGVRMLVRSAGLAATMSRYLIRRIEENPLIQVHFNSELVSLSGDDHLEEVSWCDKATGEVTTQARAACLRHDGSLTEDRVAGRLPVTRSARLRVDRKRIWTTSCHLGHGRLRGGPTCSKPAYPAYSR